MSVVKPVLRVDVRGEMCPMPVLKTRQAITQINIGDVIEVLATDPASKSDLESWARKTGNKIVAVEEAETQAGVYRFLIQRLR